jgi:hypothetical protein
MAKFGTKLVALVKPCSRSVFVLAVTLPLAAGAIPAQAQDIFGFFRAFSPRVAPPPTYQPYEYRHGVEVERPRPKVRSRPKLVPLEQTTVRKPIEPKPPGEIENPVPALLADGTLRPGDMVMFPDGLRVFTGKQGSQHKLTDFKLVSQAGKAVPRATRKLAANLRPGENTAWSTGGLGSGGKLAVNTRDVETTGSVRQPSRRSGSRSR